MNMRTKLMALVLATLPLGGTLVAQDAKRFDAGLSWSLATDNLAEITNAPGTSAGLNLDLGYNTTLAGTSVPLRLSVGVNDLPGHDLNGSKTSLIGYQAAGDIFTKLGASNVSLVTGISLNKWTEKKDPEPAGWSQAIKGTKFGIRAGLEYRASKDWSFNTLLQVVEFGTTATAGKGLNASWLQLGAKYHF